MGGALARPSWLSSPTLGRANRFLSTAAVSLMTPRRPLMQPEKVKVRTLAVEDRTEEDSECYSPSHLPAISLADSLTESPTSQLQSLILYFLLVSFQLGVEGSHGNDGLLLGRPVEEPDQHISDKSLLEIVDGIVMMYNLSVHQQLGKVS